MNMCATITETAITIMAVGAATLMISIGLMGILVVIKLWKNL